MGVLGSRCWVRWGREVVKALSFPLSLSLPLPLLNGIDGSGVRDSAVMVTGRQKRVVSAVKVVKAFCRSSVTGFVSSY